MESRPEERLDSWKEIAAYLKRDITTVQRWEKRERMPLHRHVHDKLGSVYAFRSELDDWALTRNLVTAPDRARTGAEAADTLPPADAGDREPAPAARARRRVSRPWAIAWFVAGAALVVALLVLWRWSERTDYFWRNPLANAEFQNVTDLGGTNQAAAVSRDGKFVAFLSDRGGRMDVWVTQTGTGQFYDLTHGTVPDLVNPSVRTLGFSPDGALVTFWARGLDASDPGSIGIWAVPTLGGAPHPYAEGAAEMDWSTDGTRLVYHTPGPGDPMFVKAVGQQAAGPSIFAASPGLHAHFPSWSPSGAFIYFVQGTVPDAMDIWRVSPGGGTAERITFHNSRVSHPVLLDERTLLYLATDKDGSGPWLYGVDVERRVVHRVSSGLDRYTSLAASIDSHRLVATLASPTRTIWSLPPPDAPSGERAATPTELTGPGFSPRLGPGYLLYVSSTATKDVIWTRANGVASELWSAPDARVIGGPEIAPDGRRIAFSVRQRGSTRLYAVNADGTNVRIVSESLALDGAPAWAPDGRSMTSAADSGGAPHLFQVPLTGEAAEFSGEYAVDPVWSPDGRFLLYSGADVGATFPVKALTAGAAPYAIPDLTLSRGDRRLRFVGPHAVAFLRGDLQHKDLWRIDLVTGAESRLTDLPQDFNVQNFDVSPDGREIVLERVEERSDVVLIDLAAKR